MIALATAFPISHVFNIVILLNIVLYILIMYVQ